MSDVRPSARAHDPGAVIRDKLSTGRLPRSAQVILTLELGVVSPCDGCETPITGMDHVAEMPDGRKLRFHAPCIEIWNQERLVGGEQSRFVIPQPDWEGNDPEEAAGEVRCAGCGLRIQPLAGRYRVDEASFHPDCHDEHVMRGWQGPPP